MDFKKSISLFILILCKINFSYGTNCFQCDSNSDEFCATVTQNVTTVVDCLMSNISSCAIWTVSEVTYRGCEKDIPELSPESYNFTCDYDGCNNVLFPEDRLKCVHCNFDDDDCITPEADYLWPCRNFVENDTCYTYVIDDKIAIRGCSSDSNENSKLCEENGDSCIKCTEDFCNTESGIDIINCITCSKDDPTCGYTQKSDYETKECQALYGRENVCLSYTDGQIFIRGCFNDFPQYKDECSENPDKCHLCSEDECNSMKMIKEYCAACDSEIDSSCLDLQQALPTLCGEGTFNQSGCYHYDKDGITRRGCVSSMTEQQECPVCRKCHGFMCNTKAKLQSCFSCNSVDDPNCATVQVNLTEHICDDYMDTCKVFVKPNSTTTRGCSSELDDEGIQCSALSINCKECSGHLCNGDIFPSNRLSCFHCEGTSLSECYENLTMENNEKLSSSCHNYYFRDSCYFYIDDSEVIHRGCMSDDDLYTDLCRNNERKCRTCQEANCNSDAVMRSPSLSCVSCDSANSVECIWGFDKSAAQKCTRDYFYHETETCHTLVVNDETVIRDCTLDGNVCRDSARCTLCSGDGCNGENIVQSTCYQCSSESNNNCFSEAYHTKNVTCSGHFVKYEHRGCYTKTDEDNVVTRGCFADLSNEEKFQCISAHDENCEICTEDHCNIEPKNSSAIKSIGHFVLMLSYLITLIRF